MENNIHYDDIDLDASIDDNVINIDSYGSYQDSKCSRVESKFEYTGS
jgi:hypothetical protein